MKTIRMLLTVPQTFQTTDSETGEVETTDLSVPRKFIMVIEDNDLFFTRQGVKSTLYGTLSDEQVTRLLGTSKV